MLLISKFNNVENASEKLEEQYKVRLPLEYKKFLDKYNGGLTYKTYVKFNRKKDDVRAFYGVGKVNENYTFDVLEELDVLTDFIKKRLFPIANNISGDFYVFSLDDANYGEIFIYYHDLLGKKKAIANNFSEFIKNCSSEPIGHVRTMEEREQTAIANGYGSQVEKLRPIWREEIEKFSKIVQEEVILED